MKLYCKNKKNYSHCKFRKSYLPISFFIISFLLYLFYTKDNIRHQRIIDALLETNNLETISLNIDFKGITKIEAKRKDAIYQKRLISSDSDFVNAKISLKEKKYDCKVRLKGDLSDHWVGDKYSLRVEMKNGNLIKGMSKFSLQDPSTRKGTAEYLFLNHLKSSNCLAVNYDFVNLILNGKKMGIYAIEEHFSKEFIESNFRRVGAIATFDDSLVWHNYKSTNINSDSVFRSLPIKVRKKKSIIEKEPLSIQNDTAIKLVRSIQENSLPSNLIFEPEYLGNFLGIVRLWSAEHCLEMDDINFYFNPITTKLEPIGFDGIAGRHSETPYCYFTGGYPKDNWVNFALSSDINANYFVKSLNELCRLDIKSLFSDELIRKEKKVRNLRLKEIAFNYPKVFINNFDSLVDEDPWQTVKEIQKQIRRELDSDLLVTCFATYNQNSQFLEVTIKNCTTQPIELSHFNYKNERFIASEHQFNPSNAKLEMVDTNNLILRSQGFGFKQTEQDHKFLIPLIESIEENSSEEMSVYVRFLGLDQYKEKNTTIENYFLNVFELPNFPSTFPETFNEIDNTVHVKSGNHRIKHNLYIPRDHILEVDAGANLYFDENAALISNGKISMNGDSTNKIILTSESNKWPGIFLHCSKQDSHFSHVVFSNIKGIGTVSNPDGKIFNGWSLTGGVSAYNSFVSFDYCIFKNITSEDALNIVSSEFKLHNSNFSNIRSDAFDGDFVSGEVSNCTFIGIKGDGVDFSGSTGSITNCYFDKISDKAISIGENSQISVLNSSVNDVLFGVASKDLSTCSIFGCSISNAKIAAFSAFQKKRQFGPASIYVTNSKVSTSKNSFLVQLGSYGVNDGVKVKSEHFNVSNFYKKY